MIILLKAQSDEGWLGYIARGHWAAVYACTREEARIKLLFGTQTFVRLSLCHTSA